MTNYATVVIDHDAEFTFPALGAHSTGAHVDEAVTVQFAPLEEGGDDQTPRAIRIGVNRAADNDPTFDVGLLEYRLHLLVGEETSQGWSDVIAFDDLDQAEEFARLITTAVAATRADMQAHGDAFIAGTACESQGGDAA